jgi:hypothetical protein
VQADHCDFKLGRAAFALRYMMVTRTVATERHLVPTGVLVLTRSSEQLPEAYLSSQLSEEGVDYLAERGGLLDPRSVTAVLDHGGTTIREQVG